jgi:hypothetical protein
MRSLEQAEISMELFVLVSFIGTFVLLATHVVDYAIEVLRGQKPRASMPDGEVPFREIPLPLENNEEQYDRAA